MKAREQGGDWGPIGCRDFAIVSLLALVAVIVFLCG